MSLRRASQTALRAAGRCLPPALRRRVEALRVRAIFPLELLRRRDSKFVTSYLTGLRGVEIGAAAHNRFYLDAINVDRYGGKDTAYKRLERSLVLHTAKVDVVAEGDDLPFERDSFDFVFSSHVIEQFADPIRALYEWVRVARRYVVVIAPHRDRTFDADRPLTTVDELLARHRDGFSSEEDLLHWSVWTCQSFIEMCEAADLRVVDHQDPDDKVGNGFAVVIDASIKPAVAQDASAAGRSDEGVASSRQSVRQTLLAPEPQPVAQFSPRLRRAKARLGERVAQREQPAWLQGAASCDRPGQAADRHDGGHDRDRDRAAGHARGRGRGADIRPRSFGLSRAGRREGDERAGEGQRASRASVAQGGHAVSMLGGFG